MFEDLKIIDKIPDETWLVRLRKNNIIWLVTEKTLGTIEWEYEGETGYSSGRIGFRMYQLHHQNSSSGTWINQTWMIRPNGQGMNYSQLMLPVEGHLSDDPPELDGPEIRSLQRQVSLLEHRLSLLERGLWLADSLSGMQPQQVYPRRRRP